ncbi:MAG: type II secretion system F family protein [Candidatus Omnitrophica bacterium]|nr:type II secretion system F family protein [Candidatus Omnitrophota bacterium]MDD5352634.1 type II secretion system F family protein [Candidatus Omnitrophota bacterium]MDD5550233.1 type II secretion system F family protein [Candidatus Omnitrophota bacterium]
MPKFSYIGRTKEGIKDTGLLEAANQDEAVAILQRKGLVITSIVQYDISFVVEEQKKKGLAFGKGKVKSFKHEGANSGDLVIFARQLAMLLGAGVSLMKSLDVIGRQIESHKLHSAVTEITKDMESGRTFRDSLAKHKSIFSELWLYLIETGEASGNLPMVLGHLADYLEDRQAFKTKIVSALIYPCILFVVAIGAVMFFVIRIVPTFTSILTSMNVELPMPTKILIAISNTLRKRFLLIVLIIIGIVSLIRNSMKTDSTRSYIERIQIGLPVIGNFFRFMMIESFSTTMSILIESGVPIIYALDISERSQPNKIMREIIGNIKINVREGKSFSIPLEKTGFFPPMVIQMISTGEEIGELSGMFKRIAKYYQDYLSAFVARLTSIFEPVMILFMGVIIGSMVISIFLPIFSLATASGR